MRQGGRMRFLLLAPTQVAKTLAMTPPTETLRKGTSMRSRFDFDAEDLQQFWTDLPSTELVTTGDPGTASITKAGLCRLRGFGVLALEVDVDFNVANIDLDRMESQLTHVAEVYANQYLQGEERNLAWVGRTHLLRPDESSIPGWLAEKCTTVSLSEPHRAADVTATVSWGNGEICGYWRLGDDAWRETARGMIDAQVMWREISSIAGRAAARARTVLAGKERSRTQLRRFLNDIEELSILVADHNLAADEQMLAIQGNRKTSGEAWLRVWGYHDMVSRVERRLQDLKAVAERRSARINARYQASVEVCLLILGALTLFDLALSTVSVSLIGLTGYVPGEGMPLSVFQAARSLGGDFVMLLAALLMGVGVLWLWWTRKVK